MYLCHECWHRFFQLLTEIKRKFKKNQNILGILQGIMHKHRQTDKRKYSNPCTVIHLMLRAFRVLMHEVYLYVNINTHTHAHTQTKTTKQTTLVSALDFFSLHLMFEMALRRTISRAMSR